jgi:hypothetical protein
MPDEEGGDSSQEDLLSGPGEYKAQIQQHITDQSEQKTDEEQPVEGIVYGHPGSVSDDYEHQGGTAFQEVRRQILFFVFHLDEKELKKETDHGQYRYCFVHMKTSVDIIICAILQGKEIYSCCTCRFSANMDRKDRFSRFCFQGGFTCEKTEAATAVLVLAGAGELYTIDYEDQ